MCCGAGKFPTKSSWMLLKRETGSEERVRGTIKKRKKCEQNLIWTLALSVTSFPAIYFVPIFRFFPVPCARSPAPRSSLPFPRYPFLVLVTPRKRKAACCCCWYVSVLWSLSWDTGLMEILKKTNCLLSIHDLSEDVALSFCDVTFF